jgi:hypothetical protein
VNRIRTVLAVGVAAGLLFVAGCTSQPTPPTAPVPTPSDAPTEPALTEPRTVLDLTCNELFGLDEVQPLLVTPVQVRRDETTAPLGVSGAALQQAGASLCEYGGENRTDGSYDQGLQIQAVPYAAAAFDTYATTTTFPPSAIMDTIGDRSVLNCQGSESFTSPNYLCWADFVVGEYWVSARMSDAADLASEAAADLVTAVLGTVVERIRASGPDRALWTPPEGADTGPLCADPAAPAALLGQDPAAMSAELRSDARQGVAISGCRWTGADGASMTMTDLRSGAWAFDKIAASPGMIFHRWLQESTAFDVPGTDGALVTCVDQCSALVSWRGSLVQLSFDEPSFDPATAASRVTAWAAALP